MTLSIAQHLHDYIRGERADAGTPAARSFAKSQTIGKYVCRSRDDAREAVQGIVGGAIYLARRPQSVSHTAIVCRTGDVDFDFSISGSQIEGTQEFITVEIIAAGVERLARDRVDVAWSLLYLALNGWTNGKWGERHVHHCSVDGGGAGMVAARQPNDGSDRWEYMRQLPLSVWSDAPVASYPVNPTLAQFKFVDAAGVGDDLRLENTSVMHGRSATSIAWVIRTGSETGPVVLSMSGAPTATPTESDVSGTYAAPEIDRAAYGLSASGLVVNVSMTITDATGDVARIVGTQTNP